MYCADAKPGRIAHAPLSRQGGSATFGLKLHPVPADAHHRLVMDRATIARTYLRGWFLIDLVSSIPFSELLTSPSFGFVQLFKVRLCCWPG
jgi:hypothetical protein